MGRVLANEVDLEDRGGGPGWSVWLAGLFLPSDLVTCCLKLEPMSSVKARRISSRERAVSFGKRPLARGLTHRRAIGDLRGATEATKADGGALGMRLVTNGELDAHREESHRADRQRRILKAST